MKSILLQSSLASSQQVQAATLTDTFNARGSLNARAMYATSIAICRYIVLAVLALPSLSIAQEVKLTASDGAATDRFGSSVSVSEDRIVVGASQDDDNGPESGSAYVYEWDGSAWQETRKLTASDGATKDEFGHSVSISGDRIVVGASLDDDFENGANSGSAYVYQWDGSAWQETRKLTASDGATDDRFGRSVSISGDRIVVGAEQDGDNGPESGSAYVYEWDGSAWQETRKLTASDGAEADFFGVSVSVSGDRIVVGALTDDDNGPESGSAYVYEWDGSAWQETRKLTASDGVELDFFGVSVSVSGDRIVVGAGLSTLTSKSGSAYVYEWDGSAWQETRKLTASDGAVDDTFGESVSVSGDRIVVGALKDDDNGSDSGSAYVYGSEEMTTAIDENVELPTHTALEQNYPNPFNPSTSIRYNLPQAGHVTLTVYDLFGRAVATLVGGQKPTGNHEVVFDAGHLASGTYFYRLTAGSFVETKRMILLK